MESIFPEYIIKYSTPEANRLNKIGMDYDKFVYGDAVYEVSNNANRYDGEEWLGNLMVHGLLTFHINREQLILGLIEVALICKE